MMKLKEGCQRSSELSRKVISIAAGEGHTLALTGDGCVYSWGRGMFGRLGTGSESDELCPVQVRFDPSESGTQSQDKILKFVGISAGAYHSLALADDGSVWSWGYNAYNSAVPCLVEQFLELGSSESFTDKSETRTKAQLKVSSVKAGGMMSLAIDNFGGLWIWGNCSQQSGEEGGFSFVATYAPFPVRDLYGHKVVKVACGNEHVVALVTAQETCDHQGLQCYCWGSNNHGQLGLGDREKRIQPHIIGTFNQDSSWVVYEVACGAFHTALLTHRKRPGETLESVCWTFGLGDNGQLGHGTTQSVLKPQPVEGLPQHIYVISVDCGLFHTSVVSSAGDVWSWGMEKGLGLCPNASFTGQDAGDAMSPLQIPGSGVCNPEFHDPIQVACGAAHTVVVALNGYKLWSWGRGRSGFLGDGKAVDCFVPTAVLWPPLSERLNQQELDTATKDKLGDKDSEGVEEIGNRLSSALEEIKLLKSKLYAMEQYASILHRSIFGKPFTEQDIPISLWNLGTFDITKEWENMLESADHSKMLRLEQLYRSMLASVKDKQLKRRIQEIIKECLPASLTGQ
uniref:Uncharacterized protein MANES_03G058900 n=1 Tax=Rhizophora mucronata TaxID=61149 RepID=A0A2P2KSG4_RHIMU